MKSTKRRKPAEQGKTLLMAIAGLGVGLWCLFSQEWADDGRYYVPSQLTDSGTIRDGRELNRNRQIVGVLFFGVGLYSTYCLVRRKSPFYAARQFDPEIIHQVIPLMPQAMSDRSIAGRATVEFVISTQGEVTEAKVDHATHPEFGAAVLKAVTQWKFEPAMQKNAPVALRARQSVEFTPEGLVNLNQGSFRD